MITMEGVFIGTEGEVASLLKRCSIINKLQHPPPPPSIPLLPIYKKMFRILQVQMVQQRNITSFYRTL